MFFVPKNLSCETTKGRFLEHLANVATLDHTSARGPYPLRDEEGNDGGVLGTDYEELPIVPCM